MSLISRVGRRSMPLRLLLGGIYLVLTLGAFTMIYPFALMLSTATTSGADGDQLRLIPRYWFNDTALFRKYLVDAAPVSDLAAWFGHDQWFLPSDIKESQLLAVTSTSASVRATVAADWRRFIAKTCPDEFKMPLFVRGGRENPLALRPAYLRWLAGRYGEIDEVNRAYDDNATTWNELELPTQPLHRWPDDDIRGRDWRRFITSREPVRTGIFNIDATVYDFLVARYGSAARLTEQTGWTAETLSAVSYDDLARFSLGERTLRAFFRRHAPLRFVRVDAAAAAPSWRRFLRSINEDPDLPLDERLPRDPARVAAWARFVQRSAPIDALDLVRPQTSWRTFLTERYGTVDALNRAHGTPYSRFEDATIGPTMALAHYDAYRNMAGRLRWTYLTHNFLTVIDFIAVHGRALWVTVIYIVVMIGTTLTVNPLAAYALSRFGLRHTHHLLVFLLATMAFPAEVLMIPSFLLIKSFPLGQMVLVGLCVAAFVWLKTLMGKKMPLLASASVALLVTAVLSGYVLPRLAARFDLSLSVSLLNSFWALVLPSLANGYGIFLLKGFFDGLPAELYEAAVIDGAGELTILRRITLPLCKPILAVMALGAFTAAYGAFMHAFLVCQDPAMWTLMVFLYEFQQQNTVPLVMASLVIAAVPTLIVFVFCQNIILRGIIIPSFK